MNQYSGKTISNGITIGRILFYSNNQQTIKQYMVKDTEAEVARYEEAKSVAIERLTMLYKKALEEMGESNAMVFEMYAKMLEDREYSESVCSLIQEENMNAEYAVVTTSNKFSKFFADMEDAYFKARAVDIMDISGHLLGALAGSEQTDGLSEEPVILVAEDISPSEFVRMDKSQILAFITRQGANNSHTAIFTRTMGIPGLVGVEVQEEWNGQMAIVDGTQGILIIAPDAVTIEKYKVKKDAEERATALLALLKGKPDETKSGKSIKLYANIGSVEEVDNVLKNDAAGIGLFRSECLYLEKDDFPTEEEQFSIYKTVAQRMRDKKVVIRTLDIGADKQVEYLQLENEENPALGYRAIRICLNQVEMFKTQLRAIYRASAFGNIAILIPMIISLKEVQEVKALCKEIEKELENKHICFGKVELGVMIETPAAVMISDMLAKEVDFFSIGTNDLIQYTLVIDRQNAKLNTIFDTYHPAVFRMIQMVIDNAHKEGCPVGICGELGADTTLTEQFIQMGIDELSVSPNMVLPIRKIIRELE